MDFALNELQLELRELAASVLRDACTAPRLAALEAGEQRLDRDLWAQLRESGLVAVSLPEAAGGAGLGFLEACLVFEQVGATTAPVPLPGHTLAAMVIAHALGEEVLAPMLAAEGWLACSSRRQGNTLCWTTGQLNGVLSGIPHGEGCQHAVVPAFDGEAWVLCLLEGDASGLHWERQTSTGFEPQARLTATAAPARLLPGAELPAWLEQRMIVAVSMAQCGVVEAAVDLARQHVCEREQFGVKIGSFQSVAHRLADCWIDAMNLRAAALAAAAALDARPLAPLDVYTAQVWAADAGHRVLASAQHVHGGLGHDRDYPLWRYAVWARQYEMALGGAGDGLEKLGAAIAAQPQAALL